MLTAVRFSFLYVCLYFSAMTHIPFSSIHKLSVSGCVHLKNITYLGIWWHAFLLHKFIGDINYSS